MASSDLDASEDVNDFLLRIRELGEKRDKEDEERTKKLEEEILQGRKEREARRAERARSISPTKDSPLLDTARLSTSSLNQRVIDPPEHLEPTVPASDFDTACRQPDQGESRSSEIAVDLPPKQSPTSARSGSGTLPWQQRPSSRDFNHTPTFTSTSPTRENRLRTVSRVSDEDQGSTQCQIAPPSPSKDAPSFRQSTDRAPDYLLPRTYSEDVPPDVVPNPSPSQNSPPTTREYGAEPENPTGDMERGEERSWSPSRPSSTIGDSSMSRRYSTVSSVSTAPGLGSPMPLSSAQKFEARKAGPGLEEQMATPPSPRRMSPERSTSPTKGLGGFVQSAMMKRSDSVSKRWSAQLPSGLSSLSRTNSIASNRNSFAGPPRSDMPPTPTSSRFGRDGPPSPHRPGSSHSEATVFQPTKENERPSTPPASRSSVRGDGSPTKTPLSLHTRSSSALGWDDQNSGTSPMVSRTMDSKRWSPTKASWLESALNRPETPRHMKQPSQQSPWSKERQARGSVDLGRRGSFKEVTPVGLMRSTGPGGHFKKPSTSAIPDRPDRSKAKEPEPEPVKETVPEPVKGFAAEPVKEAVPEPAELPVPEPVKQEASEPVESLPESAEETRPESISKPQDNITQSTEDISDPSAVEKSLQQEPGSDTTAKGSTKDKPPALAIKPLGSSSASLEPVSPKPKSQSPVVDFRSNLKRREVAKESPKTEEPLAEFKNVFGRLRKTETSNYVAPDKLKDNILKGKAALNTTGGPKKSQRVDEFKDSILKQKEAMKAGGGSLRRNTASENNEPGEPAPAVPEAIAKRQNMTIASHTKTSRSPDAPPSPSPKTPGTPRFSQASPLSPIGDKGLKDFDSSAPTPADDLGPNQSEDQIRDPVLIDSDRGAEQSDGNAGEAIPIDSDRGAERSYGKAGEAISIDSDPTAQTEGQTGEAIPIGSDRGAERSYGKAGEAISIDSDPTAQTEGQTGEAIPIDSDSPAQSDGQTGEAIPIDSDPTEQTDSQGGEAIPIGSDPIAQSQGQIGDPVPADNERVDENKGADSDEKPNEGTIESKPKDSTEEAGKAVRSLPSDDVAGVTNAPPAAQGPPAKGKLAGRINPALAGLLSRGPPAASEGPKRALPTGIMGESTSSKDTSASFTHMTKNRARGPRRRLPKATAVEPTPSVPVESASPGLETTSFDSKEPEARPVPVDESVGEPSTQLPGGISSPTGETTSEQAASPFTGEPADPRDSMATLTSGPQEPEEVARSPTADLDSNDQQDHEGIDRGIESQKATPPVEPAMSPMPVSPMPVSPPPSYVSEHTVRLSDRYSSPSPSPLQTSFNEERTGSPNGTQRGSAAKFGNSGPRDMSPREKTLPSPPVPPKDVDRPLPSPGLSSPLVSDPAEAKEIISGFFKTTPNCNARVNIDPQLILTSGNSDLKIRTLKKQIWEITADVRRQDLPANQEYILYEGSMYLCVHVFEIENSTRTEVHLWCGDDVPEASIDDAQVFARKVARENGCKLELLKQGKETAHFIGALGGILITRRGSNSRSTSSALYMLCGRRHLGQMVFDEVDLARRNLCSGYPFVISAPFGNLYLWKGKGSGAEETGAARLIGMDLGLTGEIEEVTEGEEPESFFENFPDYKGSGDYIRSEHWHLKPNHAHFQTRLLRIDHELGQRSGFWIRRPGTSSPVIRPNDTAQEIVPFCHRDLTSKDIYILDIFFEIYVIVGNHASQRSAEFASAVIFAHEYGILAASLQDRPFIPKTFVSIGGLPDSCRSVFRKWSKRSWQEPLRVLTLNAAIDAIRS